ncbi:MAG: site-2 protease family protein [Epulopiscium sp.]|nr:site-2 protease family protein [Candidatus Epulonipiscium sp.]
MHMITDYIFIITAILIAITIHEFAHAWVATALGDPTPKNDGRLTLNPLKHIDPIGLLLFVIIRFGWSKPVRINASYFEDRKKGSMWVALSGPLSNLITAFLFGALLKIAILFPILNPTVQRYLMQFLRYGILFNVIFTVFNLLPIPPLDGSKLVFGILSPSSYFKMLQYEKILQMLLLLLLFMGILPRFLTPIVVLVENIIFGVFQLF